MMAAGRRRPARRKEPDMPRTTGTETVESLGDVLEKLGDISPRRIPTEPAPGKATEHDLIRLHRRTGRLYELVDGVLVEKIMGYPESSLACDLIRLLGNFVVQNRLGNVSGPDGTMRLMPGLVRIPDVAFVRREKLPGGRRPSEPIAGLVPDLAVEVLSEGNTRGEMQRKLREYFVAGVTLVWLVDPRQRHVEVYTAPDRKSVLQEDQALDGGDVLPGLFLPVAEVFAEVPREEGPGARSAKPASRRKRRNDRAG
jgi:Uma2 family endonuclease